MEQINGIDLYQMFNYGTAQILNQRKTLNDINVFPVPDSDTGNNLASTMQAIAKQAKKDESFHHALDIISESALYGARGNSGVIFAQFVNGLRIASKGKQSVSIEEFAEMVTESVKYTYESVSNPVEGTMLTVIKDWANGLMNLVKKGINGVKNVFEQAFQSAKNSLEGTKEKLPVLKKNDVVDSGAMGFVLFLQGINAYYNKEILEEFEYEEVELEHTHKHGEDVKFRYCTEGLVSASGDFLEKDLRNILEPMGDSLIIAKGLNIFRIHIHTNQPEIVFQELKNFGRILTQKVDNMIQDITLESVLSKTLVITDSIADIDQDIINKENIVVVPISVHVDGIDYFDKLTINNEILFDLIPKIKEYPTTASPSLKYITDLFDKYLEHFDNLLVIAVSGNLSVTQNMFRDAAKKCAREGKRIHVIDTLNNSITEGLLVKKATTLLNKGHSLDEVINQIDKAKRKTSIIVCLNTFKYAVMGGRLPKVVGKIGNFFGLRPIMSLDKEGKGAAFGMALSKKGITKKIVKLIKKEMANDGIEAYGIVHCLNPKLAEEYKNQFTDLIGFPPAYITEVSSAVAIHSGIGTVAIGYIRK
ncbi:MAG TPA: DegV family protein [Bacillota bacterium]|nr:DegV family protein [Bacillota bacterium]